MQKDPFEEHLRAALNGFKTGAQCGRAAKQGVCNAENSAVPQVQHRMGLSRPEPACLARDRASFELPPSLACTQLALRALSRTAWRHAATLRNVLYSHLILARRSDFGLLNLGRSPGDMNQRRTCGPREDERSLWCAFGAGEARDSACGAGWDLVWELRSWCGRSNSCTLGRLLASRPYTKCSCEWNLRPRQAQRRTGSEGYIRNGVFARHTSTCIR